MKDKEKDLNQLEEETKAELEETAVEGFSDEQAAEVEAQRALAEEYLNRLQRLQADFENYRRRITKEKEEFHKYASESLICSLLPILDNFERAIAAGEGENLLSGVEMIFRQLKEILEKEGLCSIEAVKTEFDPNRHEAVMTVENDDYPDNTVIEEFQKGYLLKDKVIRPAMVKVSKN